MKQLYTKMEASTRVTNKFSKFCTAYRKIIFLGFLIGTYAHNVYGCCRRH